MTRIFLLALLLTACGAQAPSPAADAAEIDDANVPKTPPASSDRPAPSGKPPVWGYEVIKSYPHGEQYFTQGFFIHEGVLYESTGLPGASSLIRHDLFGNATHAETKLPGFVFGEGSTVVGDRIISLTWQNGVGHVHDLNTLELIGEFALSGEGWGLTYDGKRLIMSDGTDRLRFLDPETYEETGSIPVRLGNRYITRLNELEYIGGEVWANVWETDVIVRIDPDTGSVKGLINLAGLYQDTKDPKRNVLNGIAYDADADRLFVTGKRWPELYEIKLIKNDG